MHNIAAVGCRLHWVVLGLALAMVHCQDDGGLLVPDRGVVPRADARVQDHEGELVMLPFSGEPVTLTLDASHSRDPDGRVVKFRWLSGLRAQPSAAAGAAAPGAGSAAPPAAVAGSGASMRGRLVPDGEASDWPDDIERPEVTLNAGKHAFTLWVIDDRGLTSAPDTVRVQVGD